MLKTTYVSMKLDDRINRRTILRALGASAFATTAVGCGKAERIALRRDAGIFSDASFLQDGGAFEDTGIDSGLILDAAETDAGQADAAQSTTDSGFEDSGVEPETCQITAPDAEGPFHRAGAPARTNLADLNEPGDRLEITGAVFDSNCGTKLDGAVLDVWQADAMGRYDNASKDFRLRGILMTDKNGEFAFSTVRPGNYPDAGGMRPAHIHFIVTRPGFAPLTTQLYFQGDPYLGKNDSCSGCNSEDETLVIELTEEIRNGNRVWVGRFNIVLEES